LPVTVMFCGERSTTLSLVQPFGVESDCNATVAAPLCAPAAVVLGPATRLVVSVEPGLSIVTLPTATTEPRVEVPLVAVAS
jgi:hypothetical protein